MANETRPTTAPYGSWRSPITPESLLAESVDLAFPKPDGADLYWLEGRPSDGGRVVLVQRAPDGTTRDLTPAPFNVRSRVHEYGGGAYDVANEVVAFCHFADRRVYRLDLDDVASEPVAITPEGPLRYGDLRLDVAHRSVYAVCEDHSGDGEAANRLVRLDLDGDNADGGAVLVDDHDFVSSPSLSPDGTQLAWVQWSHPHMPWEESELCVADVGPDGSLLSPRRVAGGSSEGVSQPRWVADGVLIFLSDRTNWWNLYACAVRPQPAEPVALWEADSDFSGPDWSLGNSTYGITRSGKLLCTRFVDGVARLGVLDLSSGDRFDVESDVRAVGSISVRGDTALMVVGFDDKPSALVRFDVENPAEMEIVRTTGPMTIAPELVSHAEPVRWKGVDGSEVYGFYFPPTNPDYSAPDGELPPLLVNAHGGPTGLSLPIFDPRTQYWTSRGIAVLQVNYGGSSGYGRAYRERLRGTWGVVDVDDCVTGAQAMAEQGKADPARLAIRGGSAGGYTTLAAMTFRDVFNAGASYFGIGDLELLAQDTHKFESRYLDGLIGPYPERRDLYEQRSPIHFADRISAPLLILQGADDPVVPQNQAHGMADALRSKGLPVALCVFEGEGHGFRKAENIIAAQNAEISFYSQVFGFDLADDIAPLPIDNLESTRAGAAEGSDL